MSGMGSRVVPALLARNMEETLESCTKKLGFRLNGRNAASELGDWAEVQRDGVVLQFHVEPAMGTLKDPVMSGTLYFFPGSVTRLAEEFEGKGSSSGDRR